MPQAAGETKKKKMAQRAAGKTLTERRLTGRKSVAALACWREAECLARRTAKERGRSWKWKICEGALVEDANKIV